MSVRGYLLGIDWAASGDPSSTGEDDTSDVRTDDITVGWGRDTTQAGAMLAAAAMEFILDNTDTRYSPGNPSSPLAGLILPGRRVVLRHTDTLGATVTLFDGILDMPELDPAARTLTARCLDAWGRPATGQLSTAVYSGLRTGDAINLVLDAIGWRGDRNIEPGATLMPWWWEEGTDAATAIERIVWSEGPPAVAYVQGGVFTFEDRFHRLTSAASTISAGTFTNVRPSGTGPPGAFKMARDSITYDHGLAGIVNSATFSVPQRVAGDLAEVWASESPITVPAGGTVAIPISLGDPVINAVVPTEGNGIDSNTGAVTATLSRTSGAALIITLAASVDSIVARLALSACPIPVAREVQVSAEDASSVGVYGRNGWPSERGPVWASMYDAQAIATRIVATYANNRPVISFEISNVDATYLAQIRNRRISDRVTIRDDVLGVNGDFIIEAIGHTIRKWGAPHRVRFTCEVPPPMQPANVFTFDLAGHGFNDGLFGVDGIDAASALFTFDVAGHGFDDGRLGT